MLTLVPFGVHHGNATFSNTLHNEKISSINNINLNIKNLSAELGIFLIEKNEN